MPSAQDSLAFSVLAQRLLQNAVREGEHAGEFVVQRLDEEAALDEGEDEDMGEDDEEVEEDYDDEMDDDGDVDVSEDDIRQLMEVRGAGVEEADGGEGRSHVPERARRNSLGQSSVIVLAGAGCESDARHRAACTVRWQRGGGHQLAVRGLHVMSALIHWRHMCRGRPAPSSP